MKKPKRVPVPDNFLTQENIERFATFAVALKRIHVRLINSGYTIQDGTITPPAHMAMQQNNKPRGKKKC